MQTTLAHLLWNIFGFFMQFASTITPLAIYQNKYNILIFTKYILETPDWQTVVVFNIYSVVQLQRLKNESCNSPCNIAAYVRSTAEVAAGKARRSLAQSVWTSCCPVTNTRIPPSGCDWCILHTWITQTQHTHISCISVMYIQNQNINV